jgi:5-(carboxyamino)imidazole ribonucleotide mutase
MSAQKMIVPLLLGSEKDQDWAKKVISELDRWGIEHELHILSAHKVPEMLIDLIKKYNEFDGQLCYITIAGRSNGLSGVTAGSSIHPVIACPPFSDKDDMAVNVNSTLQMPSDVPVMTILDPVNAALAIVRIFALGDQQLREKYREHLKKVKSSFRI